MRSDHFVRNAFVSVDVVRTRIRYSGKGKCLSGWFVYIEKVHAIFLNLGNNSQTGECELLGPHSKFILLHINMKI
jgi:hypothetical protein